MTVKLIYVQALIETQSLINIFSLFFVEFATIYPK